MAQIYIAETAMTTFGKHADRTLRSLAEEAVREPLADAGATADDVQYAFFFNAAASLITGHACIPGQIALRHIGCSAFRSSTSRTPNVGNMPAGTPGWRDLEAGASTAWPCTPAAPSHTPAQASPDSTSGPDPAEAGMCRGVRVRPGCGPSATAPSSCGPRRQRPAASIRGALRVGSPFAQQA